MFRRITWLRMQFTSSACPAEQLRVDSAARLPDGRRHHPNSGHWARPAGVTTDQATARRWDLLPRVEVVAPWAEVAIAENQLVITDGHVAAVIGPCPGEREALRHQSADRLILIAEAATRLARQLR